MLDGGERTARQHPRRRALLKGAGVVAGLGAGLGVVSDVMSSTPAVASSAALTALSPTGDTSGVQDYQAIQGILSNGGQNTVVLLGSGVFYVSQPVAFTASKQAIRGQGRNITVIQPGTSFSGTSVIFTGTRNQFLTVDSLTVQGPTSGDQALNGATQLNGIQQTGGTIRSMFTNLHFLKINGYPFIFDGQNGNNAGTILMNVLAETCAAVCCLQGDVGPNEYLGSATLMNVSGVNIPAPSGAMAGQPAFLVQDYEDLLAWAATPSVIRGKCASCFFYCNDTGTEVLIEDDSLGSPSDIGFYGGIIEADTSNQCGIRITGAAHQISMEGLKIAYNTNHGISVEGTGSQIAIRNCQFQNNGQIESGTTSGSYYDLNWSGTATGMVRDCVFNTTIKPVGTSGVVASVNMNSSIPAVYFTDCQFPQSNVTGPKFTHYPRTFRDCVPVNPVGKKDIAVPASGSSTSRLSYDATFYITANSGSACTVTADKVSVKIPAGAVVPVFVPAATVLTVSYTKAPTWTVAGY